MPLSSPVDEAFTRRFRNALGMFATGIAVVTARAPDGQRIGLTINSFNSVSLAPPLVVWSLASEQPSRALLESCEYYAINVLAEDQEALSRLFASRAADKFHGLETDRGMDGAPLLRDCCARFECRNTARYPGGDHILFVSEVIAFDRKDRPPLVYHGGAYRRLAP